MYSRIIFLRYQYLPDTSKVKIRYALCVKKCEQLERSVSEMGLWFQAMRELICPGVVHEPRRLCKEGGCTVLHRNPNTHTDYRILPMCIYTYVYRVFRLIGRFLNSYQAGFSNFSFSLGFFFVKFWCEFCKRCFWVFRLMGWFLPTSAKPILQSLSGCLPFFFCLELSPCES